VVLVGSYDSAEVGDESMRNSEVGRKTLRPFVRIERSGLTRQVDLRRLEAAKDDSTLVGQHAVRPVETQLVSIL